MMSHDSTIMADKSTSRSKATKTEEDAIYHEVSPNIILLLRTFNFLVLVMAIISFVICLVQGNDDKTFYLLACNTVRYVFVLTCFDRMTTRMRTIVYLVSLDLICRALIKHVCRNWWYRNGDLGAEKYWYIFLVGFVLIFQCVTTDIFVFHEGPPPTQLPPRTTRHINFTTRSTARWTTHHNATTKPHFMVTLTP